VVVVVVDTVTGGAVMTVVGGSVVVGAAVVATAVEDVVVDSGEAVVDRDGARTLANAAARCELPPQPAASTRLASTRLASAAQRRRFHTIGL
jgi:hypothetical protein